MLRRSATRARTVRRRRPHQHTSFHTALIPSIDLIMAGVDPLTAIRHQLVVAYTLLAAAVLAAFVGGSAPWCR